MSPLVGRWIRFNFVGLIGVGVQLGALAALKSGLGLGYMVATALAVETAVLHNFVWHERFTWKDRSEGGARAVALRLLRFHLGNGLISILGNLALMRVLAGWLGWHYLPANAVTIAVCSLANFLVSERYVFRTTASEERPEER